MSDQDRGNEKMDESGGRGHGHFNKATLKCNLGSLTHWKAVQPRLPQGSGQK